MRIQREQFLALAAALATGVTITPGCHEPEPSTPVTIPADVPPQLLAIEAPPRVAPTIVELAPPAPPHASAAKEPEADVVKPPNPYDGTPVKAQSCSPALNREGRASACALKPPGPTCESFTDTVQECPSLNQLLKPRVAAAAIDCLERRSGTKEICAFNVTSICAYEALQSACLEPSARVACDGREVHRSAPLQQDDARLVRGRCQRHRRRQAQEVHLVHQRELPVRDVPHVSLRVYAVLDR